MKLNKIKFLKTCWAVALVNLLNFDNEINKLSLWKFIWDYYEIYFAYHTYTNISL